MSQFSCEIYAIEERYYRIIRVFLKSIALWPYQQSFYWRMQKILFAMILMTFILVQLLSFITMQFNRNLLLNIFWFVFPITFCMTKYCFFAVQANTVKRLQEHIRNDWSLLKSKLEIDIVERYAYIAKLFTIFVIVSCVTGLFFLAIIQLLPLILDIILPLNESRPCQLFLVVEYFINQEKYLYVIMLHELLVLYVAMAGLASVGATFIMYLLHVCALLKIASYRVKTAFKLSISINSRREYLLSQRIADAVVMHRRAIEFIDYFMSSFALLYIILIIVGVVSLSFSLFQCLQQIITAGDTVGIIVNIIMISIHLLYMFIGNYAGQLVTDHGVNFFEASYDGLWYMAPVHTQKLILFLMQKGLKNVTVTFGYIYDVSLEGFATLTNMAVSYFMLMYQTR